MSTEDEAFELWSRHYDKHLKRLYEVFQTACSEDAVRWHHRIDFFTFRDYVYETSSKYLSSWI